MRRWWLIIALLLSLGLNVGILSSIALHQRAAGIKVDETVEDATQTRPDRLPRVVYRMADELGLEGEKRKTFVEIQRAFFEQTLAARGRMGYFQHEVRREIVSDDPDRQVLDRLLIELSSAHTDLERAFVTNLLDSRELLDPDQERRYRHFLRRMRQVRSEVERRFRQRWRGTEEGWERHDPRGRRRLGEGRPREPRRFRPPAAESREDPAEPESPAEGQGQR